MWYKWLTGFALIIVLAFLQACGPEYEPEEPCGFVQNSYGERVSWKYKLPVKMYIHTSVQEEGGDSAVEAILRAMELIEMAMGRSKGSVFEVVGFPDGPAQVRKDGYSVIYWTTEWEQGRQREQARTSIHYIGNQIRESDIKINGQDMRNFHTNEDSEIPIGYLDLESLMVHELLHVLGLVHLPDGESSVMVAELGRGVDRRDLTEIDRQNLKCEY